MTDTQTPRAQDVVVSDDGLTVDLTDGRTITAPLAWYPRLAHARGEEQNNWRLIGDREGIHWLDLDEDVSVENLLLGKPSRESQNRLPDGWSSGEPLENSKIHPAAWVYAGCGDKSPDNQQAIECKRVSAPSGGTPAVWSTVRKPELCIVCGHIWLLLGNERGNPMNRFEYKCVCILGAGWRTTQILNEYGRDGWELVTTCLMWHYFKRPLV